MVRFSTLRSDGTEVNVRVISNLSIQRCPSYILLPEHYRADGTCRHDEPNCERDGCDNLKWDEEIFCQRHLEELGVEI